MKKIINNSNKIAIVYDFDKTLTPKNMQEYGLFADFNITADEFWEKADAFVLDNQMNSNLGVLYLLLKLAKKNKTNITREQLVNYGKSIEYFPGVEKWFNRINNYAKRLNLEVEHYLVTAGHKEIIEGTSIYKNFKQVFGSEYYYENNIAIWPKNIINYTLKTQCIFRINKQALDLKDDMTVNMYMPLEERPIPFDQMIYIGDGYTDIPSMRLITVNNGHSIAILDKNNTDIARTLKKDKRVSYICEGNYTPGSNLDQTVKKIITKIKESKDNKNEIK